MRTVYRRRFLKELANIPSKTRIQIEKFVFEDAPELNTIEEAHKIAKMTGYPSFYKIRFGQYRIGLKLEHDKLIFERVLHRKDIYRFFP